VLRDWFCLEQGEVDTVMLDTYQPLALVDPAGCLNTSVHAANQGAGTSLLEVFPSPFTERTTVRFQSEGGRVLLAVYDGEGRTVRQLLNRDMPAGEHTLTAELDDLPAGVYYCRLQQGARQQVRSMMKVR